MNLTIYSIGNVIGYNMILIVALIISAIMVRFRKNGFILYGIAIVLSIISMIGSCRQMSYFYSSSMSSQIAAQTVVAFILIIGGLALLFGIWKKHMYDDDEE